MTIVFYKRDERPEHSPQIGLIPIGNITDDDDNISCHHCNIETSMTEMVLSMMIDDADICLKNMDGWIDQDGDAYSFSPTGNPRFHRINI